MDVKQKMKFNECTLLGGLVKIRQPEKGFRVGLDTVMVAASVPAKEKASVLDMGAGVGGISLCLAKRLPQPEITAVELQQSYYEFACQNIADNNIEDRVSMVLSDICDYKQSGFDVAVCNPPFLEEGSYISSPNPEKEKAIGDTSIDVWVKAASRCLKKGGQLVMIHRADALQRIIQAFGTKFGRVEIFPLFPRAGEPAKRVVIRAVKESKGVSQIYHGMIIHQKNGEWTPESEKVLREGGSLF